MPSAKRDRSNWGLNRARKAGLRIVEPMPNELQIDIDGSAELAVFRQQWSILEKAGINNRWSFRITPSKRAGKFHILVCLPYDVDYMPESKINNLTEANLARILYQAILGSDIRREAFNLCRVLNGNKYPIVFFEKVK